MGVGAGDRHLTRLERLAQRIERLGAELGKLVEKENAVVGQRDFAGFDPDAAAGQRGHAGGMMWRAERSRPGQRAPGDQAGDGLDQRGLQQLRGRQRRQYPGQALGEHRFSRAGRPDVEQIVPAGRRDLQRALGVFLTFDVAQVRSLRGIDHRSRFRRAEDLTAAEMIDQGDQRTGREDRGVSRPRRFWSTRFGADQAETQRSGGHGGGQSAGHRRDLAVEVELADRGPAIERVLRDDPHGRHQGEGDREVVMIAFLR